MWLGVQKSVSFPSSKIPVQHPCSPSLPPREMGNSSGAARHSSERSDAPPTALGVLIWKASDAEVLAALAEDQAAAGVADGDGRLPHDDLV